jgi:hypothetical protein
MVLIISNDGDFSTAEVIRWLIKFKIDFLRMKDLLNILPLSRPSIEKRRLDIKGKFGNRSMSDRDMILYAKSQGFIS